MKSDVLLRMAQELSFQKVEDLLAGIGFGEISIRQVVNRMLPKEEVEDKKEEESLSFTPRRLSQGKRGGFDSGDSGCDDPFRQMLFPPSRR